MGEDLNDEKHECHPLFSEMEELFVDGDDMEWKETARWIKFEEDVEEGYNFQLNVNIKNISNFLFRWKQVVKTPRSHTFLTFLVRAEKFAP